MIRRIKVGFWGIDSILEFVNIVAGSQNKIELVCGNSMLNAKSLFSVLSVKAAQAVELVIDGESGERLIKSLDPYIEHGSLLERENSYIESSR